MAGVPFASGGPGWKRMTHAQWNARIKSALALADRNPRSALRRLSMLARALESQLVEGVDGWHMAQTLQLTSLVQSRAGDYRGSASTLQRVAEQHARDLQYQMRGFVAACAAAALQLLQNGDRPGAVRMLRKAAPWAASLRPRERLFTHAEKTVGQTRARG
jgi:hypothetical protein